MLPPRAATTAGIYGCWYSEEECELVAGCRREGGRNLGGREDGRVSIFLRSEFHNSVLGSFLLLFPFFLDWSGLWFLLFRGGKSGSGADEVVGWAKVRVRGGVAPFRLFEWVSRDNTTDY